MGNLTFEERHLHGRESLRGRGAGLCEVLPEMRGVLVPEETELRERTGSALEKLQAMSDAEFDELDLFPDFDEE